MRVRFSAGGAGIEHRINRGAGLVSICVMWNKGAVVAFHFVAFVTSSAWYVLFDKHFNMLPRTIIGG